MGWGRAVGAAGGSRVSVGFWMLMNRWEHTIGITEGGLRQNKKIITVFLSVY